jgi:hypothetical protein
MNLTQRLEARKGILFSLGWAPIKHGFIFAKPSMNSLIHIHCIIRLLIFRVGLNIDKPERKRLSKNSRRFPVFF